jgi:DNA-binding ferritin-like protein
MYKTKNDLAVETRATAIRLLGERLSGSIDLMHQAKQAHWSVKRPNFTPRFLAASRARSPCDLCRS